MDISEYEAKFIQGVLDTYEMLKTLDDVKNDDDFWKVFGDIKACFNELEAAATTYYAELKKDGGDTENCSLSYEFNNGIYNLYDKYWTIVDTIAQISPLA